MDFNGFSFNLEVRKKKSIANLEFLDALKLGRWPEKSVEAVLSIILILVYMVPCDMD